MKNTYLAIEGGILKNERVKLVEKERDRGVRSEILQI